MIVCEHLRKRFGSVRAVDDVSFTVGPGEVLGFLGPNGAGKSTTMRLLAGFLAPDRGRVVIAGHDLRHRAIAARRSTGYLPENGPLYPEMTVLEHLVFAGRMRGVNGQDLEEAIRRVRRICHLEEVMTQTVETLSKGYRRRVALAQCLLHDPPVLILDEPTDGLDPNQKREIHDLLGDMSREKAILLSTHVLEEIRVMCNRVILIDRGRIVVDETPAALAARDPSPGAPDLNEVFRTLTRPDRT